MMRPRSTSKISTAWTTAMAWALLVLLPSGLLHAEIVERKPDALDQVDLTQRLDAALPQELEFVDEQGHSVNLGEYFSPQRPVLLSLVYYRCPMLCTLVLDGMVDALREVDLEPGRDFELVTVTIDPTEKPTLARQKKQAYVASYGREGAVDGWHFLTGGQEPIERLADAVGFHYRYLEDRNEYAHPAALFVITPEGRISRYLMGVRHDPRTVRLALVEASAGEIGSLADQFLLYCYRYDETEGRYAPVAMRLMRVGGGAVALLLFGTLITAWVREARHRGKRHA